VAYKEVKIGKTIIPMKSNAATVWRFKQVFHQDLLKAINKLSKKINNDVENMSEEESEASLDLAEIWTKVGFIMAMQANDVHYSKVNEESFYKWIEQFENGETTDAMPDIIDLYNGNTEVTSEPKKQDAEPSEI